MPRPEVEERKEGGCVLRRCASASCLAVVCLIATACSPGVVTATSRVSITGRVLDASGTPIAGATVLLVALAAPTSTAETALGPGPEALACFLAPAATAQALSPCATARQATTDRNGRYAFTMNGAETDSAGGAPITFVAASMLPRTPGRAAEPGTSASFSVQHDQVAVPALRSWGASLTTVTASGQLVTSWPSPTAAEAKNPSSDDLAFISSSGSPVWTVSNATSGLSVDPRVLEDTQGDVEVESNTSVQGSGTTFQVTYRTALATFQGPGAPPSRGAPCSTTGSPTQTAQSCPVTAGDLASPAATPVGRSGLVIDLGKARSISFVVVRGTGGNLLVESSSNGTTWSSVGGIYSLPSTLAPTLPEPARYLRIRPAAKGTSPELAQISVWG
ncbi:MAG: hypothetical protein ACRDJU_07220 [Actinomycetota bacterium]